MPKEPAANSAHPDAATLKAFVAGRLQPPVLDEVALHLESCEICASSLNAQSLKDDPLVARMRAAQVRADEDETGNHRRKPIETGSLPVSTVLVQTLIGDVESTIAGQQKLSGNPCNQLAEHPSLANTAVPSVAAIPGYQMIGEIARGGMGVVYAVRDLSLDRELAVKTLIPGRITEDAASRFDAEAKITARLTHPGIPQVHEYGTLPDGAPYLAMKLVRGTTFSKQLKDRVNPAIDRDQSVQVFESICQTMAFAHSRKIIHRDLKPHNVMVGEFGEVQVMDWGLAKRLRADPPVSAIDVDPAATAVASSNSTSVTFTNSLNNNTRAGDVLGTPAYMPPEQASGDIDHVDATADVFSLGAILCEILTGFPPYQGPNSREIWRQALQGNMSASAERLAKCDAEPELVSLAKDCLAIRPEDRPRDAGAVVNRLEQYRAGVRQNLERAQADRIAAEVLSREERKRRRVAVGMLGSLLLLIISVGAAAIWYQSEQSIIQARHSRLEEDLDRTLQSAEVTLEELHADLADPIEALNLPVNTLRWEGRLQSVRGAVQRAESLLATADRPVAIQLISRSESVTASLNTDEQDREAAQRLEDLKFPSVHFTRTGGKEDNPTTHLFVAEFHQAALDIENGKTEEVARQIQSSRLCWFWISALDHIAGNQDVSASLRSRVLEISRQADPNPWRDRFRDPEAFNNRSQLEALVSEPEAERQPPAVIAAIARQLEQQGGNAAPLLRILINRYPQNFWLLIRMSHTDANTGLLEGIGCLRAAIALRPGYARLFNALGGKQLYIHREDEAIANFKRAIELDPSYWEPHGNLGDVLARRGQLDEAVACFRQAAELEPAAGYIQWRLGQLLRKQRKLPEAIELYRQFAAWWPENPEVHHNRGLLLFEFGELAEAATSLRRAIELFPADNPDRQAAQSQLAHCAAFDSVAAKLPALLAGTDQPVIANEALTLARYCATYRKDFTNATRFYALAFDMMTNQPDQPAVSDRIAAAMAAAHALAGKGIGAKPTEAARAMLRQQVLTWSTVVLTAMLLDASDTPAQRALAISTLESFERDPEFRELRDEQSVTLLPLEERASWRQFWADVSRVRIAIESRENAPFVIAARDGNTERRHDSLAQALGDTRDGDTIEIRGDGPFDQEALSVAGKTLTVRAGLDATPVLRFFGPAASKLQPSEMFWNVNGGSLILEGLELSLEGETPESKYYAILEIQGGKFFAAGCRFSYQGDKQTVLAVNAFGASKVEVTSCEFSSAFNAAIVVIPAVVSRIEIENCLFAGRGAALALESASPTARDVDVTLSGNIFATNVAVDWRVRTQLPSSDQPPPTAAEFRVVSRENVFAAEKTAVVVQYLESRPTIIPTPDLGAELFRRICRWHEEANLYGASIPVMRLAYGKTNAYWDWFQEGFPETSMLAADLTAWEQFWGIRGTDSRMEWITFQGGSGQNLLQARHLHGPDAFLLHADFVQKLNFKAGQSPPGITAGSVGPGDAYQRWRQSPDYLEWAAAH